MSAITLAQAQTMLAAYLAAEVAVLKGQSYSIGDRALTRADLREIGMQREYWRKMVEKLDASRTKPMVRRVVPRDV